MVRLQENASAEDRAACEQWRAAHPEHERAWQRAQRINEMFGMLPAGVGMHTLDAAARRERRNAIKLFGALLVAGPAAYLAHFAYRAAPWQQWTAAHRTGIGERRSINLADGTRIELNTSTSLDVAFSATERRLMLYEGEILVQTGTDSSVTVHRPFVVQTEQGRITALGTRFVVRELGGQAATQVAVFEHAVEVATHTAPQALTLLRAGEQAHFAGTVGPVSPLDTHVADWSRGSLFADHMRLEDFATELGRYRPGVLRCARDVADLRISGVFQLDNTDNILTALPQTLPVRITYRTRFWVEIAAA
ncbi:FecR family protein [Chitinasiproducens palmae]|uniref:FecR family protein n=2 Tax=Chitinasiproducens palmae TaxID=1770053 RepID=A0A1H2PLI0_9BURK|nr:FecR family protein [Chitinasiproducens palmae]